MKILIYGSGKTGTTALTYAIKNSLRPEEHEIVFEPSSLASIDDSKTNLIVKSLQVQNWQQEIKYVESFDRKVIIVRHPFDATISHLLYSPFNGLGFSDDRNASEYINILRRKVIQPDSVSLKNIINLYKKITKSNILKFIQKDYKNILEIVCQDNFDIYKLKYEDFVDGNLSQLSRYLGTEVKSEVKVDEKFKRVARSKKHSDWKNWFTQDDIKEMSNLFSEFITFFKYETNLDNKEKVITPETSYLYVKNVINEYRENYSLPDYQDGLLKIKEEGIYIDDAISFLRSNNLINVEKNIIEAFRLNPNLHKTYNLIERKIKNRANALSESETLSHNKNRVNNILRLFSDKSDLIWQFFLDSPVKNEEIITQRYIVVKGWVVGKKYPAKKLELVCNNEIIEETPVNILRPGVAKVFPQVSWAETSGFETRVALDPKESELEILLRAIFEDEVSVDVAKIEVVR